MILDKENASPTINKALELVDRQAETLDTWKIKGLGLRLVLFGLAEVQALRLSRLAGMVYHLEETILDDEKIRTMEPKMLFGLYNLASKSLTESSEFVERVLKTMDWNELETQLLSMKAQETTKNNAGLSAEDSDELLNFLARLKSEQDKN